MSGVIPSPLAPTLALAFPRTRKRRLRHTQAIRELIQEHQLHAADLILPLFVKSGSRIKEPIASMPGVFRYSLDLAVDIAKSAWELGIKAIALFPVIEVADKSLDAAMAFNESNLICQAIQALKKQCPDLLLICDIALDPFTSHGQDGIINKQGHVLNDTTVSTLIKQSLCYAKAGADILAPSDMMDGRIGAIRDALENSALHHALILSYAVKYNSAFYGPFRDAVGSGEQLKGASKASYQMDIANAKEAIAEAALDLSEGADILMVKPGISCLDILHQVKQTFACPTFIYQVSGEYSMLQAAAAQQHLALKAIVLESLLSMKRAGADAILTYFALDAARWLND